MSTANRYSSQENVIARIESTKSFKARRSGEMVDGNWDGLGFENLTIYGDASAAMLCELFGLPEDSITCIRYVIFGEEEFRPGVRIELTADGSKMPKDQKNQMSEACLHFINGTLQSTTEDMFDVVDLKMIPQDVLTNIPIHQDEFLKTRLKTSKLVSLGFISPRKSVTLNGETRIVDPKKMESAVPKTIRGKLDGVLFSKKKIYVIEGKKIIEIGFPPEIYGQEVKRILWDGKEHVFQVQMQQDRKKILRAELESIDADT
jgi:hypothetical protein